MWKQGLAKVGDVWHYRFTWRGQLLKGSTRCSRLQDAREWLDGYKTQLSKGEVGAAKAPTVRTAWEGWYAKHCPNGEPTPHVARAESAFRLHILPHIGSVLCDRINDGVIEDLRDRYMNGPSNRNLHYDKQNTGRKRSAAGCNTMIGYLRDIVRWAIKRVPWDIGRMQQTRKRKAYLQRNMVDAFLSEIDKANNLHVSIAVRLELYLGLRESEALHCAWAGFNSEGTEYCPGAAWDTKGDEEVVLAVPSPLRTWLKKVAGTHLSPWVLPVTTEHKLRGKAKARQAEQIGKPHAAGFTKRHVKRAGAALGINISPHSLRRTFVSLHIEAGADPRVVQEMARHADIRTTLGIYAETTIAQQAKAQETLWGAG